MKRLQPLGRLCERATSKPQARHHVFRRAACPDEDARLRLALALLHPLHAHPARLDPSETMLARQLSSELATGLTWAPPIGHEEEVAVAPLAPATVLLYSLDHAVLKLTPAVLTPGGVQRFGAMAQRYRLPCRIG